MSYTSVTKALQSAFMYLAVCSSVPPHGKGSIPGKAYSVLPSRIKEELKQLTSEHMNSIRDEDIAGCIEKLSKKEQMINRLRRPDFERPIFRKMYGR